LACLATNSRIAADVGDHGGQGLHHTVKHAHQLGHLVPTLGVDAHRQVTLADRSMAWANCRNPTLKLACKASNRYSTTTAPTQSSPKPGCIGTCAGQ
jgi:hypothetical protein